jgi:hypothetical protein
MQEELEGLKLVWGVLLRFLNLVELRRRGKRTGSLNAAGGA